MSQYQFGPGRLWIKQLSDVNGVALTVPLVKRVGAVQEVSLDIERAVKELHGGSWLPLEEGSGPGKISGKVKFAQHQANVVNMTMASGIAGPVTGQKIVAYDEKHTIPAATPWTVTIAPPATGTFDMDMGVRYANGTQLTRVGSAPTLAGTYSVIEPPTASPGVYTFTTGDQGLVVYMDYRYVLSTAGYLVSLTQQEIGGAAVFEIDYQGRYGGKWCLMSIYNAKSTKLSYASKIDNWNIPEFDFSVFEPTGITGVSVMDMYFAEL